MEHKITLLCGDYCEFAQDVEKVRQAKLRGEELQDDGKWGGWDRRKIDAYVYRLETIPANLNRVFMVRN